MQKIRVLDEQTINQIAAGEVIENPASVVKELVENSLDAGATELTIEIQGGGRQLIRVTDNGSGMSEDDALLCLERHATSKIREIHEIETIGTMGFRGEAIPSIASISKFILMTSTGKSEKGTMVVVDGGKLISCTSILVGKGTSIEVKGLFFNVPVRRKFQKSPAFDSNEIQKMINNIALGYPHVQFRLISDQKVLLNTSLFQKKSSFQEKLSHRISEILGKEFLEKACYIEEKQEDFSVVGWIGLPSETRHNRTGQYVFINQRYVYSSLVTFGIKDGYGTALATNRHPVYVLHLDLRNGLVDVNVHPQKKEVRIRQEKILKEMLRAAVGNGLRQDHGITLNPIEFFEDEFTQSFVPDFRPSLESLLEEEDKRQENFVLKPSIAALKPSPTFENPTLFPLQPTTMSFFKIIGIFKQYIIVDAATFSLSSNKEGLCLIDQRAAHSRIIFEKLKRRSKDLMGVQNLLIPYSFQISIEDISLFLDQIDLLNENGIGVRQIGSNSFILESISLVFGQIEPAHLIKELLERLKEERSHRFLIEEREKQIAYSASRAALSTKKNLQLMEAQSMLNQLIECEVPTYCPFGKPTFVIIGENEWKIKFQ